MKLLRTYGRKFKKSILEVSNGKRSWSPEVVLLRPSRQNRSEILFDSLCKPASKLQRPSNTLTKYRHDSTVFDSSTGQSGSDHGGEESGSPGHLANQAYCKRRQRNCNPRNGKQTTQRHGMALSQVDKNARQRRQGIKRQPTKLSLKSKKQRTRKRNAEQWNSSELGNKSSGSSSCEILRRHPQETDSYTPGNKPPAKHPPLLMRYGSNRKINIEGSGQPKGKVLENDLEWSNMGGTDCLNLSSLSGMSSTVVSTPNFSVGKSIETSRVISHLECGIIGPIALRENRGHSCEQHCTTDSLPSSFYLSGNRTNWVTIRNKRNRNECKRDGKENQKRVRLNFEKREISDSASDTSALKCWSPLLASTPVSHGHAKEAKARKEWFLSCAEQTSHNAGPLDSVLCTESSVSDSVHAPDSFTSRKVQQSTADKIKDGPRQKLCGTIQFQVIPHQNCSNLPGKSAGSPVLVTRSQRCERSSPLSSCRRAEVACMAGPSAQCEKNVESSVALQAKAKMKDLRVVLTDILAEVPSTQNTRLNECAKGVDISDLQGKVELCKTQKNKSQRTQRKQCLEQSPCLASGGTARQPSFLKELRSKLVDTIKVMPECPRYAPALFAQSGVKHSLVASQDCSLQKKFHLKEARVVLTDLKGQGTRIGMPYSMSLCNNPLKDEVQGMTSAKAKRCDVQYSSSPNYAELYFSCSTVTDQCVKATPQSYNKQFELRFPEHSGGKRAKVISTSTSSPEHLAAELSRMISSAACCTQAKLLQPQVEHRISAASFNQSGKQKVQYSSMDNYHLGSRSAAARTPEIGITVEHSAVQLTTSDAGTSSKQHSHFENLLESGMAAYLTPDRAAEGFGLLMEQKVVLENCDHCQLMLPPPSVVVKKKPQHNNNQLSNCTPKQAIAFPGHNLVQDEEPYKNNNWTDCVRRQVRLTMARKSVVPSPLLLDASQALLEMCNQDGTLTFEQALGRKPLRLCKKIGEGTFGEVFRIKWRSKVSAVKIVPIEGSFLVNGEKQKTASEILPEAIMCQELSALSQRKSNTSCPNFIEVKRLYYIQDRYHWALLKQWDAYDAERESENERPDFFKADQRFLMFEFADGGVSLEDYKIKSATVAKSIFLQVTCALAVAEAALEFEHRDLHWGNILVAPTKRPSIQCRLPQGDFQVETSGVLVSLIDYTLSRLRKGGAVIFTDVSEDEELFSGSGDYQFDIYRCMKQHNQNDWKSFRPYTNVLWLHYLARKLLEKSYCARSRRQCSTLAELRQWSDALVLQCPSSQEVFLKCINKQLP